MRGRLSAPSVIIVPTCVGVYRANGVTWAELMNCPNTRAEPRLREWFTRPGWGGSVKPVHAPFFEPFPHCRFNRVVSCEPPSAGGVKLGQGFRALLFSFPDHNLWIRRADFENEAEAQHLAVELYETKPAGVYTLRFAK